MRKSMSVPYSREDVLAAVRQWLPDEDTASVLAVLDAYSTEPYERERERVQIAVLKLSEGDVDKLLQYVTAARLDYRDVLYWAEYSEDKQP